MRPVLYFVYALCLPSLPLAWPVPPLDWILLATAARPLRWIAIMIAIDLLLGQPQALLRWSSWAGLWWARERYPEWIGPLSSGLLTLGWYFAWGPSFSWLGGVACALQAGALTFWWSGRRRPEQRSKVRGWGWHT